MTLPDVERKASLTASPVPFHPVFFDGQLWWTLRLNNPYPSTGTVIR